jgi:16S rRNA (uracil1498-N3)-methyltransferase
MPRIYLPDTLQTGASLALPAGAARHVQVLRMQPGQVLTLFNGLGGEFDAVIERMGRSDVQVQVGAHRALERAAARAVHLVVGLPANERFDWLVEKATELGTASITPLVTERSVLRLSGERAQKKLAHWHSLAAAACEQCGRNRLPRIDAAQSFSQWAQHFSANQPRAVVLSLQADAKPLSAAFALPASPISPASPTSLASSALPTPLARSATSAPLATGQNESAFTVLSGPEGGLTEAEEAAALRLGFQRASLGAATLRAETAALAALAVLAI